MAKKRSPMTKKQVVIVEAEQGEVEKERPIRTKREELEQLYRIQMDRIEMEVDTEKSVRKLMPHTVQEIRLAMDILEAWSTARY